MHQLYKYTLGHRSIGKHIPGFFSQHNDQYVKHYYEYGLMQICLTPLSKWQVCYPWLGCEMTQPQICSWDYLTDVFLSCHR